MLLLLPTPSFPAKLTHYQSKPFSHTHLRPLRCTGNVDGFTERSGYLFELSASEADSLTDYGVSKIAAIYKRKPLILFRRIFQIGTTFGKWFGLRYLDRLLDRSDQMFEVKANFVWIYAIQLFFFFVVFIFIYWLFLGLEKIKYSYDTKLEKDKAFDREELRNWWF